MKQTKKWLHLFGLAVVVLFLTACGTEAITSESTGLWDRYIIYNLSQFIIWLSNIFGGSYAIGIIIFTVLIRIITVPLTKMQFDSQRQMQEIQPEIDKLKAKYPGRDRASMEAMQREQREIMEANGVNQFAGCLPVAIQLPIMMALYQAIGRTEILKEGHFLWMSLGQMDPFFVLPIVAAVLTFANSYFTMKSSPSQGGAMKTMTYVMPAMILLISVGLPAAVTLYWVVSNAVTLIQTFMLNNPYKIIEERQAKAQAERDKQRELKRALKRATRRK
ncbi:membrane protein insertase YidC [Aerococcaceae bacterium NML191292]|nr:membrane protein insertase YidC [Aerococcaceae bacterium NML210727]MCW6654912.1 membrane protein insertase YidC [Aerococcaceae bacterium NML201296]MCW6660122.1 membrane protein insertase YidC [Aerococcaceae bacterium NML191292]MCW6662234.1 membrane protein insertase YidC [Aerococcaceae bacterium NML201209]MCW6665859.1 membrane protein insertase YidC [Aerococcaceae bacterium NML191219]MCW6666169.1 membrane protein insertase YidC [Aerococcaceae bacterium NML190938]MCW6676123.1 membrane prote